PVSRGEKVGGGERVRINPQDAARRGIRDGDIVRLFNPRGACLAGAVVDADVMPGVVVMATGAWFDPADAAGEPERHGNPNVLTLDIGTSPLAQATSALTPLVEIERWEQPAPAGRGVQPPGVGGARPGLCFRTPAPRRYCRSTKRSAAGSGGLIVSLSPIKAMTCSIPLRLISPNLGKMPRSGSK